jgi:hypothetical protein
MAKGKPIEYEILPFPRTRNLVIDVLRAAHRKHMIHGLIEVDVTRTRQYIREQEARTGEQLSFTTFITTCLGKAVDMNKYMHAMRNWRGQLVLFDEVDVCAMIEVELKGRKIPMPHIFRAVNKRTYRERACRHGADDGRRHVWRGGWLGDPAGLPYPQRHTGRHRRETGRCGGAHRDPRAPECDHHL